MGGRSLDHDPAGSDPTEAVLEFLDMRGDRLTDRRRTLHSLEFDLDRRFHFVSPLLKHRSHRQIGAARGRFHQWSHRRRLRSIRPGPYVRSHGLSALTWVKAGPVRIGKAG